MLLLSCLLLAAACSSGSSADKLADDDRAGEVVAVEGRVVAERGDDEVVLAVGDDVLAGDTIVTAEDASVTVRLLHNDARWTLEGGKRRTVRESAAWRAPKSSGGGGSDDRTAAAGRQAERSSADTRATAPKREAMDDKKSDEPADEDPGPSDDDIREKIANQGKLGIIGTEGGEGGGGIEDVLGGGGGGDGDGFGGVGLDGKGGGGGGIGDSTAGDDGLGGQGGSGSGPKDAERAVRGKVAIDATVTGGLDHDVVQRVMRRRLGMFRSCYDRSLKSDGPGTEGRLVVTFVIQPTGRVARVTTKVESGSVPEGLAECVASRVKRLRFPTAEDDSPTTVTIPFTFERAE